MGSLSDEIGRLVDTDPIALGQRCMVAEDEVERLRDEYRAALRESCDENRIETIKESAWLACPAESDASRYRKALERIGAVRGVDGVIYCGVCGYSLDACEVSCPGRIARAALDGVDERVSIYDYHADGCEFNTGGLMHWDCVGDCPSRDVNGDSR